MALGSQVVIRKTRAHPRYSHRVRYREGGKTVSRYFKSERQAKAHKEEIEERIASYGTERVIADADRDAVAELAPDLAAHGITVRQALDAALTAALDAATAEEKAQEGIPTTLEELVAAFIERKTAENRSRRHLSDLRSRLGRFVADHAGVGVAEVNVPMLDGWLSELGKTMGPQSQLNYRKILHTLFGYAVAVRAVAENPVTGAMLPDLGDDREPEILSLDQCARWIAAADYSNLPSVVILLIGGLRRSEVERLNWEDVDFGDGEIKVNAKKGSRRKRGARIRYVPMRENLKDWLAPYAGSEGRIWPGERQFDKTRRLAGFAVSLKSYPLTKEEIERGVELEAWPPNGARHTCASMLYANNHSAPETTAIMGHTESVLFKHYKRLVKSKQAEAFWNIAPAEDGKVIKIAATG